MACGHDASEAIRLSVTGRRGRLLLIRCHTVEAAAWKICYNEPLALARHIPPVPPASHHTATHPISDMDAADILVRRGLLTKHQVSEVRAAQNSNQNGSRVEQTAVQLGFCTEESVLKALGEEVGLDYVDLQETQVDLSLLKDFPPKLLHRQALFPVRRENGSLVVATSDPFDLYPLDELSASTGLTVVPVLASRTEIA
ncbi:MAG TPA: hypothetical protein VGI75_04355, partial [Pirellulales bacterium]